jgi:hypothetical protein
VPEGLSPQEAHHEVQHHEHHAVRIGGRHGRTLQISEAVVLALVTVTAAWSGFAAAEWGTESRLQLAAASTARTEANRAEYTAQSLRNFDASTFNAWFTAYTLGSAQKMAIAERRFRPSFRVAFDAWRKTNPDVDPDAPPGPTYMPQYRITQAERAKALDRSADAHAVEGERAGVVGDRFVRITVVLAGVLFLIGIGSTFSIVNVRYALLALGCLLLATAVVLISRQPGLPG